MTGRTKRPECKGVERRALEEQRELVSCFHVDLLSPLLVGTAEI
jgi:hypothetical protein